MRAKREIVVGLLVMILMAALVGCGSKPGSQEPGGQEPATQETNGAETEVKEEITAEEFITKMIATADGSVVTKADSKALFQAIIGDNNNYIMIDEVYTTLNEYDTATADSTLKITCENHNGTFNAVYNLVEEQGVLYYYANQETGWIKYESCLEKEEISRNFVTDMNLENAEVLGFETEGVQYNGQDVYKLSVKLKDANIRELIFETGLKWLLWAKEYATIDLSDITVNMDYYVDPQSAQVLKVEAVLEGMKNLLTEYGVHEYSQYFGYVLDVVELQACKLLYENISYEDFTLPKMAFEDKKSSVLVHQKDTTYTINMLSDQVEVICPAGWSITEKKSDGLYISKVNSNIAMYYFMSFDFTPEDLYNNFIAVDIDYLKDEDLYISEEAGEKLGEFDTYGVVHEYGVIAFAYKPVGDSLFTIRVYDNTTQRADLALEEVVEWVHFTE